MTDIEIANSVKPRNIKEIADKIGIPENNLELYGNNKAKINDFNLTPKGKLILVTAINPTKAGEGKTTVSIGLADAFTELNKKVCLALREPSLGPVFGIKGGATGGGYSQVVPMEDINLHFTGDFHAITCANNLLCSFIDNHIFQGNELKINPQKIVFNRCLDLNDRALRQVEVAVGEKNGVKRSDRFNITAASEIMAILCLSLNIDDLKNRLGDILIAYDENDKPVYAKQLGVHEAMTIVLKEAIKPNLVQTLIGTPTFIHGGPFANIAHGCNSVVATKLAMTYADYTITEAGFGADLGAQKFLDTKCRVAGLTPNVVVIVATVKALKLHGGVEKEDLMQENKQAVLKGIENLSKHVNNIKNVYKLPVVVAINKYSSDTQDELLLIKDEMLKLGVKAFDINVWGEGGKGALTLAKEILSLCDKKNNFEYCYEITDSIEEKINKISKKIYGAKKVIFTEQAQKDLMDIKKLGLENYHVIMAKTQTSLSDNAKVLGAPKDFDITIKELQIRNGAKFIVAISGSMLLMPGLPKTPAGAKMKIDNDIITGLF